MKTQLGRIAKRKLLIGMALAAALIAVGLSFDRTETARAQSEGSVTAQKNVDTSGGPGFDMTAMKAFFVISITNSTSSSQQVAISDQGATFVSTSGAGSCSGWNCTVNAGHDDQHGGASVLQVHLSQPITSSACVAGHVDNSASVTWNETAIGVWARADIGLCSPPTPTPTPTPGIHLAKAASTNTLPAGGGPVTYTYTVTNTGNVLLTGITVADDVCSPVTYQSGDANNDGKLDIAETWTYTCTQTLTASTTNTGTATGHSGDATVTSQSQASVTVEQSQTITQTLTVHKVVSPASDGGTFDLTIDGTTVASGVGNGGSGSLQVSAGQHTVGETAHAGTSLSDYTVSYSSNCPNGVVTVAAGANADCTITNTRKSTPETPTPTATPETPTPTATPTTTETPFIPPLVVVTPTPTPTAQPTETQPPTQPPKTPTAIDTVAGEKTPGPAATPKPPETGTGAAYDWFHSNQALEVIALFILSAVLSGLVVLTTPGKKRD